MYRSFRIWPDIEILRRAFVFFEVEGIDMADRARRFDDNAELRVPRGFDLPAARSFGGQKAVSANAPSMLSVPNFRASRRVGIRSEIVFMRFFLNS